MKQLLVLLAATFFCWSPGKISTASPPQEQTDRSGEAGAGRDETDDGVLYRGRTFWQWRNSLESDLDPSFRNLALKALGAFGANGRAQEAIEAIKPHLKSKDVNTARSAVNSIGRCGPEAAPVLAQLLEDPEYEHRDYAAIALVTGAECAAKPYVPLLVAMTKSKDDKVALAGGQALVTLGLQDDEVMSSVYSTLKRYATPKKGVGNNLPASALFRAFENSGFSAQAKDKLFLNLLQSDSPFEKDCGGRLLIRYGSSDDQVRAALTREYRRQLSTGDARRFKPSFHDLADNSLLLTCQVEAMSELDLACDPPTQLLRQFLYDLKNMRLNYMRRKGQKGPRGELNPAAHPATIPFLVRLIEQLPAEQRHRALLRSSVELLGDFGEEAQDAMPALRALREKLKGKPADRFPVLNKAVQQTIDTISGEKQ